MTGEHGSLGVFVWTKNSPEDREVPRGAPTLSLLSNLTGIF